MIYKVVGLARPYLQDLHIRVEEAPHEPARGLTFDVRLTSTGQLYYADMGGTISAYTKDKAEDEARYALRSHIDNVKTVNAVNKKERERVHGDFRDSECGDR